MKYFVVACALLVVVAGHHHKCGPLQKLKIKEQWSSAYGVAHNRVDFGIALWRGVFRQAPEAHNLLKRVHSDDLKSGMFQAHSARVLGALNMVISTIDDGALTTASLEHLRDQHKERGIPISYFHGLKNSLMKVIPAAIGRCFDYDAWNACIDVIIHGITDY